MSVFSKKKLEELQSREHGRVLSQTVLIVDDEDANRAVMANILRPYYHLVEAKDGRHALDVIESLGEEVSLACIVSDQRMPRMTGIELFQHVQARLPLTVRIIVTGYVDVNSIVDSINKAEIYRFIVKPFDANDFLLTIRRGVESYEMRRQLSDYHKDLANQVRLRTRELEESRADLLRANQVLQDEVLERRRIEEALRRSSEQVLALYNNASCGYHAIDRNGIFRHINNTELAWLGRERNEVVGVMRIDQLIGAASWGAFLEQFPQIARDGWVHDLRDVELELLAKDGALVPVLLNAVALEDDGQSICRFTVFNITERKQEEMRIEYLANHDALTGLPNRTLMLDRLERDLLLALRHGRRAAVLFIDLDRFKPINDNWGHHVGDKLLQQAACRLKDCLRKSDSVARFGGDEFVVSLGDLGSRDDVIPIADKILSALSEAFIINGHELHVGASIGASIFPDDGDGVDALLRNADAAMYLSKSGGRNRFAFYEFAAFSG
jgi:diguanylate cyclase (GGDEF)-like protein/PAS domain S-box-containing protein